MEAKIAIVGEFEPRNPTHVATNEAIRHAARSLNESAVFEWLPTDSTEHADLSAYHGLWIAPGSPYKSLSGAHQVLAPDSTPMNPPLGYALSFRFACDEDGNRWFSQTGSVRFAYLSALCARLSLHCAAMVLRRYPARPWPENRRSPDTPCNRFRIRTHDQRSRGRRSRLLAR